MRVTIEHTEEERGLMIKRRIYFLHLTVIFSEEEVAIIEHRRLNNHIVYSYDSSLRDNDGKPVVDQLIVKELQNSKLYRRAFDSLLEAKAFDADLRNKHLPALKACLDGSREAGKSETFEL